MSNSERIRIGIIVLVALIVLFTLFENSFALPIGPTITHKNNETASPTSGSIINTTGGSITTMNLNASAQNLKWKAFVGNVTGRLVLADSSNFSIFNWQLTKVIGEVYATRSSDSVNWSGINCSNSTHIYNEELALNHISNPNDNISATFNKKNHSSLYAGTNEIKTNTCYSIHTNVNSQNQSTYFEEIILYDGTDTTNGDIVYGTRLEQDQIGFDNQRYDFQMIVPENGISTWQSSIAYYFYVELT